MSLEITVVCDDCARIIGAARSGIGTGAQVVRAENLLQGGRSRAGRDWCPGCTTARFGLRKQPPGVVARIRELAAEGLSLRKIAAQLDAEDIPTARGAPRWSVSAIQTSLGYSRPRRQGAR